MEREEALQLVKSHVKNKNLRKHMLAAEAIMRELARKLGEDEERFALAGLVHDVDYEQTADKPEEHALIGAKILADKGVDEEIIHAVKAHAEKAPRESLLDKCLYATDPLTGLIVAAALVHPDKKLASLDPEFILKRFKEKAFARGANREVINSCEDFGLSLEEFVELGLKAMTSISDELGL